MKEYDYIKLLVEKERYAKDNVHKGMTGWICDERIINDCRLVCFDNCDLEDYPIISIKIEDMEVIWSAPTKDIGTEVILSVSNYENIGLHRGLKGTTIAKGEKDNQWIVRFHKQDGLQQECDLTVDGNDFIVDN